MLYSVELDNHKIITILTIIIQLILIIIVIMNLRDNPHEIIETTRGEWNAHITIVEDMTYLTVIKN